MQPQSLLSLALAPGTLDSTLIHTCLTSWIMPVMPVIPATQLSQRAEEAEALAEALHIEKSALEDKLSATEARLQAAIESGRDTENAALAENERRAAALNEVRCRSHLLLTMHRRPSGRGAGHVIAELAH